MSSAEVVIVKLEPIRLVLDRAAAYLDTPPETLRQMARRGKIPSHHDGRRLYFLVADLKAHAERGVR